MYWLIHFAVQQEQTAPYSNYTPKKKKHTMWDTTTETRYTHTMWYLPKKNTSLYPCKDWHMNVHGSFVCNGQLLETAQLSFK